MSLSSYNNNKNNKYKYMSNEHEKVTTYVWKFDVYILFKI